MSDKSGGGGGGSNKGRLESDWRRPAGPLNVWKIIEAEERLAGGANKRVRLSIQDVPAERYEEAIKHMCDYFIVDEVTCKSLSMYHIFYDKFCGLLFYFYCDIFFVEN